MNRLNSRLKGILLVVIGLILGLGIMIIGYEYNFPAQETRIEATKMTTGKDDRFTLNKKSEVVASVLIGNVEALKSFTPFAKESMMTLLGDYYYDHRLVASETVNVTPIDDTLYSLITDVIYEKDDQYDWRRFETMVEGDTIVSFRLGTIDYMNLMHGIEGEPTGAEGALIDAFKSLNTNDRNLFGVQFRGNNKAQEQITFEVDENELLAGTSQFALFKTSYVTCGLGMEKYNQAFVLMRKYESKKWQLEEIIPLGESL